MIIRKYTREVLLGLEYLHSKGVVHRDIKAGNLLLTKHGNVKLADFGISVNLLSEGSNNNVPGSPFWMAPEIIQMESEASHPSSDIWSMGCTILELLVGDPPYWDKGVLPAMFAMVENERPPFPEDISSVCATLYLIDLL
jgi:cell division control protein CDC15